MHLEILGPIGSGKSTLAEGLAQTFNLHFIKEEEEDFNRMFFVKEGFLDYDRYNFAVTLNFLAFHLNRQLDAMHRNPNDFGFVTDTSLFLSLALNKMFDDESKYNLVKDIIQRSHEILPKRTARIILTLSPEENIRRINERNRDADNFDIDFITKLQACLNGIESEETPNAQDTPIIHLDASLPKEQLLETATDALQKLTSIPVHLHPTRKSTLG